MIIKKYRTHGQIANALSKLLTVYRNDIINPMLALLTYEPNLATESLVRLGQIKAYQNDVINALLSMLKDKNSHGRAIAADALGKLPIAHRDDVIHALITVLKEGRISAWDKQRGHYVVQNGEVRENAAKIVSKLPIDHREDVINVLTMTLEDKDENWNIRACSLRAIVQLRKEEAQKRFRFLVAILQNDMLAHCEEYLWAAETLARLAEEGLYQDNVINILLMQFEDQYYHRYYRGNEVRISAVKALTVLGQVKPYRNQVINALMTVLQNPNHYGYGNKVYIHAVEALGNLSITDRDDIIEMLVVMLKNKNLLIRWHAALALVKLRAEEAHRNDVANILVPALKELVPALKNKRNEIRADVIEALGELPLTYRDDVIDALVTLFKYGDIPYFRNYNTHTRAAETLVKLGREEAHRDKIIDVLITALKNKEYPMRASTIEALCHAIERLPMNDAEIQSPLKLLHYQFTKYFSHQANKIPRAKKLPTLFGSSIFPSRPLSIGLTDSEPNVSSLLSFASTRPISQLQNRLSVHSPIQMPNSFETLAKPKPENSNDKGKGPEDDYVISPTK